MGTQHQLSLGSNNHVLTANPNSAGTAYATISARNLDVAFNTNVENIDKLVRVDNPLSYYILTSITPTWMEFSSVGNDEWIDLTDTPSSFTGFAGKVVQVNAGENALEFGQDLRTTASPTFAAITIGASIPFADAAGVLTLQNVDALDATTEATIEAAIDTLTNLISIQGKAISLSGSLTVESASTINQDLTTDASPTFAALTLTGDLTVGGITRLPEIRAESGAQILIRAHDTLITNFTKRAELSVLSSAVQMAFDVGDGAGGATSSSHIIINHLVMQVADTINLRGLTYEADYSANFADRSLIDKEYVDSRFIANGKTVHIEANYLYINAGFGSNIERSGGLVVNFLPTTIFETVTNKVFDPGIPSVSGPTVQTDTVGPIFATGDIIQISGTSNGENDGIFEVDDHSAFELTIRGVGGTAAVEDFTGDNFVLNSSDSATIIKINVSVIRVNTNDGTWQTGQGVTTGIVFKTIQNGGAILDDLNTLGAPTADGKFIVATGAGVFAYESDSVVRNSLGLGTGNNVVFNSLKLTKQGQGSNAALIIEATATPSMGLNYTSGGVDQKRWDMQADAAGLQFGAWKDDNTAQTSWLTVTRTGIVIDNISLHAANTHITNGNLFIDEGNLVVGTGTARAKLQNNAGNTLLGVRNTATETVFSLSSNITHIVSPTNMGPGDGTVETALRLFRDGTTGTKFNPSADFQIGSYGVTGINAQSQLRLRMGQANVHIPDVDIMTWRADGRVVIGDPDNPTSKFNINLGLVNGNGLLDFGMEVLGDALGFVGYAGYKFRLLNSTNNTSGHIRLARTASTVYLGMEIAADSRDGIRFLTGDGSETERVRIDATGNVGIGSIAPNSKLRVEGSFSVKRLETFGDVFTADEVIIGVTDTSAAKTITILTADIVAGRLFIIKDESGAAGTFNITIVTQGTQTIDGVSTIVINSNYGIVRLYAATATTLFSW